MENQYKRIHIKEHIISEKKLLQAYYDRSILQIQN